MRSICTIFVTACMRKTVYNIYRFLRSTIVIALLLFLFVYSALYIALSMPSVQNRLRLTAEKELSALLTTRISIGKVSFNPLTEVEISDIEIYGLDGKILARIEKLGAGISLYNSVSNRKACFNYAEIIGLEAHITRHDESSPTNFQFIIDALKPKQKNEHAAQFDFSFEAIVIRKGEISYDILSEPEKGIDVFDKNHIQITQFSSDIRIPSIKNDNYQIDINRFAFIEKSGFTLSNFTAKAHITQTLISASDIKIELPNTLLIPEDIAISFPSLKQLGNDFRHIPLDFRMANSYITFSDFQALIPALRNLRIPLYVTFAANGTIDNLNIATIDIQSENSWLSLQSSGKIKNISQIGLTEVQSPNVRLHADVKNILNQAKLASIPQNIANIINEAEQIDINGALKYSPRGINYVGYICSAIGQITTNGTYSRQQGKSLQKFSGNIHSPNLNIGKLTRRTNIIGNAAFNLDMNIALSGKNPVGKISGSINHIDFKGYRYNNIETNLDINGKTYEGIISLSDPNIKFNVTGEARIDGPNSYFNIDAYLKDTNPHNLHLTDKYTDYNLGVGLTASFYGDGIDNSEGEILISDLSFINANNDGINLSHLDIVAQKKGEKKCITIDSDILNGSIDGDINFARITTSLKSILSTSFPSLLQDSIPIQETREGHPNVCNNFEYNLKIADNNTLTDFFHFPVKILHPINISGILDEKGQKFRLGIDAPYIQQGNKIIEKTSLSVNVNGKSDECIINAISQLDNKNGNILLLFNGNAANDRLDTDIRWQYDRKRNFSGTISLSSLLKKDIDSGMYTPEIEVNPTQFTVNDTTWHIEHSKIDIAGKRIHLEDVNVNRENQFIKASGYVSKSYDDILKLQLKNIDLGYIFETLNINHVAFSGKATGDFFASGTLSDAPQLNTSNLNVKQFSYHDALLGDADIKSFWDNENKGIVINADIHQYNSRESLVRGVVYPTRDSLAFKFKADRINVQILRPFMSAFTSDISGEASGEAELYGTFKFINMKGRLFADSFKMKLDYTNTYYSVSDSIILDPNIIRIKDATVYDPYGNTAKLNGSITHQCFKNAQFNFAITNVKNMLCFNTTAKDNPNWYGTVFANGAAFIKGGQGLINLDINMASAPNSSFTFVLSDQEEAGEYSFVTFTDKQKEKREKEEEKRIPDFLKSIKTEQSKNDNPSIFNLNLQVDANPNATINLVMDPDGGDKIRATGNGNLRIEYSSTDGMRMFGNYTVEQGRYNFTLQDIIVRDFIIKQGANIAFHGDPLNATVDLSAAYSLNANLLDLDESFAEDRDLNRTVVPVNALLKLSGIISQPEISFDLEFPTLTQDIYRKVRSIISTDDMMNQQIIYLLALSRFYTPEYMGNTNRNSDLASVASSTLSNQLANMLGQLSDKWSIAPNFHTDKGDFSDMEVELALSSRMLNNRLLLNGNFGYTDNALNNNNFIGDFDIEYLLTKNGNIRLKAYNRYNDQNYYIRNSLMTQGVGIVFKHDFNRLFLRNKNSGSSSTDTIPTDSLPQRTTLPANDRKPVHQ